MFLLLVADMCTDDYAVEDNVDGNILIDSVVVRVMRQKANCICRVSLNNNVGNYSVDIEKWSALKTSAPELPNCGLAINVNYIKVTAEAKRNSYPIQCSTGTKRKELLHKNEFIELKSKILDGTFTRGYCMQIFRSMFQFHYFISSKLHGTLLFVTRKGIR